MTIVVVMVPLVTHLLQTLPRISGHTRTSIREPHHSLCYQSSTARLWTSLVDTPIAPLLTNVHVCTCLCSLSRK